MSLAYIATMLDWITGSETELRLSGFLGALVLFSVLEAAFPRRKRSQNRIHRWTTNIGMVVTANLLMRSLAFGIPLIAGASAAAWAETRGIGLLNQFSLPIGVDTVLALLSLDFAIWLQHVISHRVPLFWRFHAMHHADHDFDATTALRFHPAEIVASSLYKVAWVMALGPSVAAVILFEIVLNACALFNHSNLALPRGLDRMLRWGFVTPDMHRVHHSDRPNEHHRNFGFCLSIWDRLFGTYKAQPALGHTTMTIGFGKASPAHPERFWSSLIFPAIWSPKSAEAVRTKEKQAP
ncbi:MAG: sterol desaturase family protein [Pseudomonadota bacterium]